jgi:hypothetical protein
METFPGDDPQADFLESEWLRAVTANPAFDFLKEPREDVYTLADGKPFLDRSSGRLEELS